MGSDPGREALSCSGTWDFEGWPFSVRCHSASASSPGLLVGNGWPRRAWATAVTTVACLGVGLLTSEWLFGWATEEELQPNVDGLSRDEVLMSSLLTTAVVVLVMRFLAHRAHEPHSGGHSLGRHPGQPS